MNKQNAHRGSRGAAGFTLLQMVIVIAITATLSAIALLGVSSARANMRRINSARQFANYIEKARMDSVRRHADEAPVDTRARVTLLNATTYQVVMDFDGDGSIFNPDGTLETRTFPLEPGVVFAFSAFPTIIDFNWRGRTPGDLNVTFLNNTDNVEN